MQVKDDNQKEMKHEIEDSSNASKRPKKEVSNGGKQESKKC
jgi:hypothetical protein